MTQPAPLHLAPVDPYAVLGIDPQATLDEIKRAYFALVREHPPERDAEGFKRIRAAYEQLRDPDKRLEADMLRLQAWPEPAAGAIFGDAPDPAQSAAMWRGVSTTVPGTEWSGIDPGDVIRAARALSDLGRHDFREDYREVTV